MTASGVRAANGSMSSASPETACSAPSSPRKPSHSVAPQENQAPVKPPAKPSTPSSTQRSTSSRSSPPAGEAGEIIGDYALGETIGKGTFGKVKLGLHLLTGEKVAVKILEKKRIVEIADVERVAREIKILKRNRHVNVIQLFEVIDSPERIFLIMEYVDSGEMFEYIVAHHRIREQEAVVLFQQIVDGLDYLHANEVTHRDLKPENLLLQTCGAMPTGLLVKIVDFGLSNTHDGGRLLRTACGSPCYAAPEMIQGKLYKGPLADIWSLGVVLFAMVCGYLPFEDSNTNMLYKKILSADYKLPPFLSHAVQDLIRRILETNPEKRYTVEMIRQHPWFTSARVVPRSLSFSDKGDDPRVRDHILSQLATVGLDPAAVADALVHKAHNALTAAYYLLYNKLLRLMKDHPPPPQQATSRSSPPQEKSNGTPRRPEAAVPDEVRTAGVRKEAAPIKPLSSAAVTPPMVQLAGDAGDASAPQRRRISEASPHSTGVTRTPSHGPQASPPSSVPTSHAAAIVKRPSSVRSGRNLVFITNGGVSAPTSGQPMASPSSNGNHPQRPHAPTSTAARPPSQGGSRVSGSSNGVVALAPLFPQIQKRASHSDASTRRHTIIEPQASLSSPSAQPSQALTRRRVTHGATSTVSSPSPPPTHVSPHPPATKEDDTRVAVAHTTAPQRIPPHRPTAAPSSSSTVAPQFSQIL